MTVRKENIEDNMGCPWYMTPVGLLAESGVALVADPELRLDDESKPKASKYFPGRVAYRLVCELPGAVQTMTAAVSGEEVQVISSGEKVNVTVWLSGGAPKVGAGDRVRFTSLMVGAYAGRGGAHPYFQSLGVEVVGPDEEELFSER